MNDVSSQKCKCRNSGSTLHAGRELLVGSLLLTSFLVSSVMKTMPVTEEAGMVWEEIFSVGVVTNCTRPQEKWIRNPYNG